MVEIDEFKIKGGNRGLPGKSFIYVVTLDYYLKMAMSYLSNTPFLDAYVSSFVKWKLIYTTREKMMNDFFNYLLVYDESRIDYLISSVFFKRSNIIEILNRLNSSIIKYEIIMKKEEEDRNNKELKYIFKFELKFGKNTFCMRRAIPEIFKKIQEIQETLIKNYLSFILAFLMKKRVGGKNPDELKYEAYQTMLEMLDSYDPTRSKVPFHNFLKFFIKAKKHKMIKEDNWGLNSGEMEEFKDNYIEPLEVEHSYAIEQNQEFIDTLSLYLPTSIYKILSLKFGILNPLNHEDELRMLA